MFMGLEVWESEDASIMRGNALLTQMPVSRIVEEQLLWTGHRALV